MKSSKEDNNPLLINNHIFIFILISLIVAINDIIIYLFKINYDISLLISVTIIGVVTWGLIKSENISIFSNFNKADLIPIIPFLFISIILMLHIDDFVDTITYHLYNQKHPFIDKINFDFLPSSTYFFPLGDRMHYIFTRYLGYRLGNILSVYASIIVYYQVKNIFKNIIPNISTKANIIMSTIILYSFSASAYIVKFNVDSFSMVVLLELVNIFTKNINIFAEEKYMYLSTLLVGISIGIKLSNIALGATLLLAIIINSLVNDKSLKNIKNLKYYDYIICIILFFFPFFIYLLNNYNQTGNPIFPFYNTLFKSPYYENVTGKDMRLGPKNFIQVILWPLIICIFPYLGNEIESIVDLIWGIAYICSIFYLITRNKKIFKLALLDICMTFIWIKFLSGYVRYGLVLGIVNYIIVLYTIKLLVDNLNYSIKKSILFFILIICIFFSITLNFTYFFNRFSLEYWGLTYPENPISNHKKYDIDGVWICSRYNNSCIDSIRMEDDPMYNIDIIVEKDSMQVQSYYSKLSKEMFYDKINNKKIYSIINLKYGDHLKEVFEKSGFKLAKILDVYYNPQLQNSYDLWYIVELEYNK